jgi:hypothetical protein
MVRQDSQVSQVLLELVVKTASPVSLEALV